jgi:thioredoxin-like negative regulator of GroEL
LEPAWEEVASKLAGEVNIAKVDVPANQDLGRRFEIKGFPTLKFFSKGKSYTYKGKRGNHPNYI